MRPGREVYSVTMPIVLLTIVLVLYTGLTACSIQRMAISSVADVLASGSASFASDDDPELVRDAIPFGLKTYESLLAELPRHKGLLLAAASGFAQYAYAFVEFEADRLADTDLDRARALRQRARRLYLRGRRYAIRGLEGDHPGFMAALRKDPQAALRPMKPKDVPFLYWLGVSWAAAISAVKEDLGLLAELYLVEAVMRRALELDEAYDNGALHEFFIVFDGSRSEVMGGSMERARQHFKRALALNNGQKASPYVSLAETVAVQEQDVQEFKRLLNQALAIDPDATPAFRLENILAQRRATWLLTRTEALFLDTGDDLPEDGY